MTNSLKFNTVPDDLREDPLLAEYYAALEKCVQDYKAKRSAQNPSHTQAQLDARETEIRRLGAGSLANNDLLQMSDHFKGRKRPRVVNTWNVFCAENAPRVPFDQLTEEQKTALKQGYQAAKEDKEVFERLKAESKRLSEAGSGQSSVTVKRRVDLYKDELKKMEDTMKYMFKEFGTHKILITATDTIHKHDYLPSQHYNSCKRKMHYFYIHLIRTKAVECATITMMQNILRNTIHEYLYGNVREFCPLPGKSESTLAPSS